MNNMHEGRLLQFEYSDANLNLALEQAIVKLHTGLDPNYLTVRFWRNPSCVVLGRGQKAEKEVNLDFCRENGIRVCRRLSGGGTVYQDSGNINISFTLPRSESSERKGIHGVSRQLTDLLTESLKVCGIPNVECADSYNIFFKGKKVSGSASFLTKTSILHHATILMSADLNMLEKCLIRHEPPFKRGESKSSTTSNLSRLDEDVWKRELIDMAAEQFSTYIKPGTVSYDEVNLTKQLFHSIYSRQDWIFGSSTNQE